MNVLWMEEFQGRIWILEDCQKPRLT